MKISKNTSLLSKKIIEIKTPGKLIFAGEWSTLEKNQPCIVLAINKYVKTTIHESDHIIINAKDINVKNLTASFYNHTLILEKTLNEKKSERFSLSKNAIETTLIYLEQKNYTLKKFSLSIHSEISNITLKDGSHTKIGLGSSAATIVSIITAILKLHNYDTESLKAKKTIFKLSAITHYISQNMVGSCADIAACTYKQPIIYKVFDQLWLENEIKNNLLSDIINKKWPHLQITPIRLPKELILCAGFVGHGSSTKKLIPKILNFKTTNQKEYNKTIVSITNVVKKLITRLNTDSSQDNQKNILDLIKKNRALLKQFYPQLETYELTKLINIANKYDAAAKFSGAGAGDCGIAICFDQNIAQKIKSDWAKEGIYPLNVDILK